MTRRHLALILAAAIASTWPIADARATTDAAVEAERLSLPSWGGRVYKDSGASGGAALLIWSNATATGTLTTPDTSGLVVRARGDDCNGRATMRVDVDGTTVLTTDVASGAWRDHRAAVALTSGSHRVAVSFTNDTKTKTCDRNLRVDRVTFTGVPASDPRAVEAEWMALGSGAGQTFADAAASGGRGLLIWSDAAASITAEVGASDRIVVRAKGDQCDGAPRMTVSVDGTTVGSAAVGSTTWTDHVFEAPVTAGMRAVSVAFTNDHWAGCDRNLRVDRVAFERAATSTLYVDPNSSARAQADAWRSSRPADAALMDSIAGRAQGFWLGAWSGDVRTTVDAVTTAAAGDVPVFVAYNIPDRDCSGGHSAGGTSSAAAYRAWVRDIADGIGSRRAIVVLEPDALAQLDCLPAADRAGRLELLRDAVAVLGARPGVAVYLDAGHSGWLPVDVAASRLRDAGVAQADGFSLNVSNFRATSTEVAYGEAVSAATGGAHFVVDTSRNGAGPHPSSEWCNPSGRALGAPPTLATGHALVDAYLWVKRPGESDGACNGGPPAGQWWADYALDLARRATG